MKAANLLCALRTPSVPALSCVVLAAALSACGGSKDPAASQVAARVNKEEVTVHQINHALQTQRGLRPEQSELASGRVLERLIDQELVVQKAQSLKMDRDPRVMQQVEASRDEIIARAYLDKIADGVAKPTPEEIAAYYNEHPMLFRERRIYQLQEVSIQAQGPQVDAIRRIVGGGKPVEELLIYLRANNIPFKTSQVVRPAEQVPLNTLPSLAKLRDGQGMLITGPQGVQVIAVAESRLQPIDEERARPAIEQFMVNDRKRRVVADDLKALRSSAKVEYVGKFAASAPQGAEPVPNMADAAASAARDMPQAVAPPPAPVNAAASAAAEGALNNSIINKGLGLK